MYSINNTDNYNMSCNIDLRNIINKYMEYINNFFLLIKDNVYFKQYSYSKYLIINGIQTASHILNMLIIYTKNIDLTFHHIERSFIYYVEFINQIMINNGSLNLNSKDASIFIYKKILYDIDDLQKKNNNVDIELDTRLGHLLELIGLYNNILYSYIDKFSNVNNINLTTDVYDIDYISSINKNFSKLNYNRLIENNKFFVDIINILKEKIQTDKLFKIIQYLSINNNINLQNMKLININILTSDEINNLSYQKICKIAM